MNEGVKLVAVALRKLLILSANHELWVPAMRPFHGHYGCLRMLITFPSHLRVRQVFT